MTSPSNNQKLRHFEDYLRRHERQLEHTVIATVEQGRQAVAEDTLDVADQAVFSYQKEMLFTQSTEGHSQLGLVRLALERLNDGSYGKCLHCGQTIGDKRLEALPWTPYCIACQEKIENGELEDQLRAA